MKLVEIAKQFGAKFILPIYTKHDWQNDAGDPIPPAHILAVMCHLSGMTGPVTLRPYYGLDPKLNDFGHYSSRQIAIHTSGASAIMPMKNKEWLPSKFQEIVDALDDDFTFVQLGSLTDPPLKSVIDLRGKTSIPQAAATIKNSLLFVGLVGFLMHLARAIDRRSVIIYGGRELPSQSGYSCNENLTPPSPAPPAGGGTPACSNHACMQEIQSSEAIDAILRQLAKSDQPLTQDTCQIEQQIPLAGPPNNHPHPDGVNENTKPSKRKSHKPPITSLISPPTSSRRTIRPQSNYRFPRSRIQPSSGLMLHLVTARERFKCGRNHLHRVNHKAAKRCERPIEILHRNRRMHVPAKQRFFSDLRLMPQQQFPRIMWLGDLRDIPIQRWWARPTIVVAPNQQNIQTGMCRSPSRKRSR